jgi:hypothetical protein
VAEPGIAIQPPGLEPSIHRPSHIRRKKLSPTAEIVLRAAGHPGIGLFGRQVDVMRYS